jgi:CDP-4-dehydro-6-deoxyglucose reductase, E1
VQGDLKNANLAHDYGFFVGNHPFDLSDEINKLYETLNKVL